MPELISYHKPKTCLASQTPAHQLDLFVNLINPSVDQMHDTNDETATLYMLNIKF